MYVLNRYLHILLCLSGVTSVGGGGQGQPTVVIARMGCVSEVK